MRYITLVLIVCLSIAVSVTMIMNIGKYKSTVKTFEDQVYKEDIK